MWGMCYFQRGPHSSSLSLQSKDGVVKLSATISQADKSGKKAGESPSHRSRIDVDLPWEVLGIKCARRWFKSHCYFVSFLRFMDVGECTGTELWQAGGPGGGAVCWKWTGGWALTPVRIYTRWYSISFSLTLLSWRLSGHLTLSTFLVLSNGLYPKFLITLLPIFLTLDLEISGYVTCQSAQGCNSVTKKDSMREKL